VRRNPNKSFTFLLCNCRSLLPKVDELCVFNSAYNCDVLFLTETWLNSNIDSNLINLPNYSIFRNDRIVKRGGGVCIYVKSTLHHSVLADEDKPADVEAFWMQIEDIICCLIYIPPRIQHTLGSEISDYIVANFDRFNLAQPSSLNLLLGDFNKFNTEHIVSHLDFKMIVEEATRGKSILDKVFVSHQIEEFSLQVLDPLSSSDHNKIIVSLQKETQHNIQFKNLYDLRHSNIVQFISHLKTADFSQILTTYPCDEKLNLFYDIVLRAMKCIPVKKVPISQKDKPWITPILKSLITERWNAFRSKRYERYEVLKEKVKHEIVKSKSIYFSNVIKTGKKTMWSILRDNTKKTKPQFDYQGSDTQLANTINTNLRQIVKDDSKSYIVPFTNASFELIHFDQSEVKDALYNINTKKASCDPIPSKLFIYLGEYCCNYITHIFNAIMEQATWPTRWKRANIIPLPKGTKHEYNNVRPISILSCFNKCLETLFKRRLEPFYVKHLDHCQHGFKPMGSTSTALVAMMNEIYKIYDNSETKAVTIMSFDIKKAFDKVNHQLLLCKLSKFLPTNYVTILSSYLNGRQQRVQINSSFSEFCDIDSGVPQGSILSPILFGLFISDLLSTPLSFCFKYADDSTFIIPHVKSDITNDINETFFHVKTWCQTNKLELNTEKTQMLTIKKHPITFNNSLSINEVSNLRILGITICNNIKWDHQVHKAINSASRSLHLLRKCRPIFHKNQLVAIYNSYVLSQLCYASSVFPYLPQKLATSFNKIFKRAHHIICGQECQLNCLINPLEQKIKIALKLFKKALSCKQHPLHKIIPHQLPYSKQLCMPMCRTERYKNSFIPFMTSYINSHPGSI